MHRLQSRRGISIHAPREGSDRRTILYTRSTFVFQSTLPARGATADTALPASPRNYFNPRSPRGERLLPASVLCILSIFQSTLPARGATTGKIEKFIRQLYFNPRSPRGERQPNDYMYTPTEQFQSTLPARGATFPLRIKNAVLFISIHAPREGSDSRGFAKKVYVFYFNPRSPRGERRTWALLQKSGG